jgi:hypothetical protein
MKHKNILLVVFFLTLFIFQQAQAGGTVPIMGDPLQVNVAPASVGILYDTLYIYVYQLVPANNPINPGAIQDPPTQCEWPATAYGCGSEPPGGLREPEGFFHVAEDYYLRNVLPNEMNFAEITPDSGAEALKAQAIAARTVASWKSANFPQEVVRQTFNVINNSTQFQVFVPGTYNDYPSYQDEIETTLNATQGQYLSAGDGHTVDAEFSSDVEGISNDGGQTYLKPVQDPISTCDLRAYGNGWGMSQRGAIRWAKGNTCPDGSGAVWPVKWNHQQILVHYYTGIDIIDDSTGNKVAPDDRWNLLWHNIPTSMNSGQPIQANVWLQNTSTTGWTDAKLGYQWIDSQSNPNPWTEINLPSMPAGDDENIPVSITPPSTDGTYTLRLDVRRANGPWFSEQTPLAWLDVKINNIDINGPPPPTHTATSTPNPGMQGTLPSQSAGGPGIVTIPGLTPGMQYRIVISGVVNYSYNISGDPQWNDYQMTYGCFCRYSPAIFFNGIQLAAQNGQTVYDPNHTYTFLWLADSAQLQMYIGDSYYADNSGSFSYQIFEDAFLGTPTPVPTSTGTTPTPQPTATLNPCSDPCTLECIRSWLGISSNNTAANFHPVSYSIQQALFDIQLFHRVEDEILSQTPQGQHYIDLYYGHGTEISEILRNNSELRDEAIATLQLWESNLQALVDGNGNTATITSGQVQAIQDFLDHLSALGSPSLQQTIASERANTPLEAAIGMPMDEAWIHLNGFPSTPILDDFNRANGSIGSNWSGNTFGYTISSNKLNVDYSGSNSDIYWSNEPFGADQEAYVTLTDVDGSAWEHDLLLKAQSNNIWGDGVLEVLYDPAGQRVQVWTYEWPAEWVQHGVDIPVTFVDGDQFGARALADGTVEVYRNGELLAARDITSWSHYADGGYIGLWLIGAENAVLDDFGGGTVLSGMQSMSNASTTESQSAETSLTSEQLNVILTEANLFWQGVPIGSNQKANVTFTQINKNLNATFKPQSNGAWGEGIVQVLYDVTGRRIQVWMYDAQKGWVQVGADIPVKFADGDKFSVRVLANGVVEIQRNGKSLAKRDVTP